MQISCFRERSPHWSTKNIGSRTFMWILWEEAISIQGELYSRDERGMWVPNKGAKILGSMCILSHKGSTLCQVSEPLYGLLKKRKKFEWEDEHTYVVQKLKKLLLEAPALCKADYTEGTLIYVSLDTSPTRIGWVICWGQGRQCGSINNICDGEEPTYESKQDTHRERDRERDRHKRNVLFLDSDSYKWQNQP